MNYKVVLRTLGNVIKYVLALLLIPLAIALYYGDGDAKSFLYTILIGTPIAFALSSIKIKRR